MKTQLIDNVVSQEELFFLYKEIIGTPNWALTGTTGQKEYPSNKTFSNGPLLKIKSDRTGDHLIHNYPLYLYVKTLVFRIKEILRKKNIGMNTSIRRTWLNSTNSGSDNHWLHRDYEEDISQTILMFITPIWEEAWKGSLYVDGQEFKFKPGSAVIFDSNEFHTGENPEIQSKNWNRITLNIVVENKF